MPGSDAELLSCFQRRARRVFSAALKAINELEPRSKKSLAKLGAPAVHRALSLSVLRFVVLSLGRSQGLFGAEAAFASGRLFAPQDPLLDVQPRLIEGRVVWVFPDCLRALQPAFSAELELGLVSDGVDFARGPAELLGNLYELLLAQAVRLNEQGAFELESGGTRKLTGTFFTPRALTEVVVARALEPLERRIRNSSHRAHDFVLEFRVCDPAVGGGAFLVQVARALAARSTARDALERRRALATRVLCGVDINPVAVAVAEATLYLFVADPAWPLAEAGRNLRVGDALLGPPFRTPEAKTSLAHSAALGQELDFLAEFPEVFERGGFDLVIGNPPWVAFAGRAAKPLSAARKAYFAAHYDTLKGYPTLHGLFVERALRLAPQGTVALVVPSPIADLQGYRAVRRAVRARHTPCEPLLEFGQDAFESVTQPCFALIAEASTGNAPVGVVSDDAFRLAERQRVGATAAEVKAPSALSELARRAPFPRELFGEMGFQTTGSVTRDLLLRAPLPDARHDYPLLEGRDVHEFREGEPRLFLCPDRAALSAARCRLREAQDYARVRFVVRQTARYPIAARHRGLPFRNSLLAGFEAEGFPPDLVVGLLNSSLYRALHVAAQRDARQAAFPQVKVGHLRALPEPPSDAAGRARIASLSAELTLAGVVPVLTEALDAAVFGLFGLESSATREVLEFLAARGASRR